jgi:hypothetical protein
LIHIFWDLEEMLRDLVGGVLKTYSPLYTL